MDAIGYSAYNVDMSFVGFALKAGKNMTIRQPWAILDATNSLYITMEIFQNQTMITHIHPQWMKKILPQEKMPDLFITTSDIKTMNTPQKWKSLYCIAPKGRGRYCNFPYLMKYSKMRNIKSDPMIFKEIVKNDRTPFIELMQGTQAIPSLSQKI